MRSKMILYTTMNQMKNARITRGTALSFIRAKREPSPSKFIIKIHPTRNKRKVTQKQPSTYLTHSPISTAVSRTLV
jgi:ribosomal protein L35AE/L33A